MASSSDVHEESWGPEGTNAGASARSEAGDAAALQPESPGGSGMVWALSTGAHGTCTADAVHRVSVRARWGFVLHSSIIRWASPERPLTSTI